MQQLVCFPTRNNNILDLIFCNEPNLLQGIHEAPHIIESDHKTIIGKISVQKLHSKTVILRDYKNADFDFDLHGDLYEGDLFPPEESTVIALTEYKLWAGVGGREKIVCNSDGQPLLLSDIKLKITRDNWNQRFKKTHHN